jgi:branched-chain amino acid transport system substrate-binding protein
MTKNKLFVSLMVSALAVLVLFTPVFGAPATGKPIKIGIIGPMDIRTGIHMLISAQMAVEKINATGGLKVGNTKRPIELVKINSNEFKKVTDAVSAAERAITSDKVDFLVGGNVAEAVSAIQDIAADNKTIYISTAYIVSQQYVERMKKNYDRYKYCFAAASMGTTDVAKVHLGITETVARAVQKAGVPKPKVAQMVEKTIGGDAIMALTTAYFPKMGMEIVGSWRPSPSASDLRAETAAIKSSNSQIIYTVFSGPGGIVFGTQVTELKIPALVVGSPAASLIPGKGIGYSVTMMGTATIPVKITDQNLAFYKEFLKRSGGEVCVMSAYDTIMNLLHNIESVGSLDPNALIKSMEVQEYNGMVGPVKYDPKDHRSVILKGFKAVYGVQQLPGGKAAIVWPTDAAVKAQPVQIPQWMIAEWKKAK